MKPPAGEGIHVQEHKIRLLALHHRNSFLEGSCFSYDRYIAGARDQVSKAGSGELLAVNQDYPDLFGSIRRLRQMGTHHTPLSARRFR